LLLAVAAVASLADAQPPLPKKKGDVAVTDPATGIRVRARLDLWVLDAFDSDNKIIWSLNFFEAGGLRATDRVSIRSLRLVGETVHVRCDPALVSGTVDLKTGKLLKFHDVRKK
jgi:hypothetical protein